MENFKKNLQSELHDNTIITGGFNFEFADDVKIDAHFIDWFKLKVEYID